MRIFFALFLVLLLGAGCVPTDQQKSVVAPQPDVVQPITESNAEVTLPLDGTIVGYDVIYKGFGEYIQDRFSGYHVGDDIEVGPEDLSVGEVQEVPVLSIAAGTVRFVDWVSGYGGLIMIDHKVDGEIIHALYGHIDLSSTTLKVDDVVQRGQQIAVLGEGFTKETDGERQHLHFALYQGEGLRKQGYEQNPAAVRNWINPTDFFLKHDLTMFGLRRVLSTLTIPSTARTLYPIEFVMPGDWDVEYIPSLQALNLYTRHGEGTARQRSQMLIRYFDADTFLTLPTVTVYSTEETTVGKEGYTARRYEIEKKSTVADFVDQPSWRNKRHVVTDFRAKEGKARYFVVAANPELDPKIYADFLASMEVIQN
ncbi:MAG: M23 family metallopeptidase [Patescibacteria group bacterium]